MNTAGSKKWINYLVLIVFMLITALPIVFLLFLSVKSSTEVITGNVLSLPEKLCWENFSNAWVKGKVNQYFLNTVIVTVSSSVLTLALGVPMAYGISRLRWRLSNTVLTVLLLGIMIPVHATLIPLFFQLKKLGMLNSYFAIIMPYVASTLPFTVYVIRSFLLTIPYEMEEAAFLDGCGVFRAFLFVMLPNIKQSLVVVITVNALNYWNEYVMSSTLVMDPTKYTLPIGLRLLSSDFSADYGAIAAGVLISVIPLLLLYLCFTDLLERGMVAGAMK